MDPLLTAALGGLLRREHLRRYLDAQAEQRRELRLLAVRRRRLRLADGQEGASPEGRERPEPES